MKIVVCIRQGRDGEINPFDACAYEEALRIKDSEIILLSMGVPKTEGFLKNLTRLGAKSAVLLTDSAFAGADTLATAYTLSLAIKKLQPDLVFCGRQTLEGDTAQTGPMLSEMLGFSLVTNVMKIKSIGKNIICETRDEGEQSAFLPALITIERINNLRLPSIRSKLGEVEVWDSDTIGAEKDKCGLKGSPTRVLKTFENEAGKRKCKFINPDELQKAIADGLKKNSLKINSNIKSQRSLKKVFSVGEAPLPFAKSISDDITVIPLSSAEEIIDLIIKEKPSVVLWGSDSKSKRMSARVAAKLFLGLCADCTALEADGETLYMYRPALSGSIIAKIISLTSPAMATVRTEQDNKSDIVVSFGYGVKECIEQTADFAKKLNANVAYSRKAVDNLSMPYENQVGLTGKTISPPVYIAIGISGAVHHIVGMERSGTVIAVNPNKKAPIFDYADYGIVARFEDLI